MDFESKENLIIREMLKSDIDLIFKNFKEQSWNKPKEQFEEYYREQKSEKRFVLVVELSGDIAGYITLKPSANQGPFANQNIPEIIDLNVFKKYQNQGIGNKLLDAVENRASGYSDTVCLAVGLHSGYGNAQKIYIKRGYVPDGSGVWYKDRPAEPYQNYCNDDDLVLYMSKKLKKG